MTREELKQAIMNDECLTQIDKYKKLEDSKGKQRVLDTSVYESEYGTLSQKMEYSGDTTNWRLENILETVLDSEGNEVV